MPPRYEQGQLASPVVGTPGVDPSAGAVEADIAKVASNAQQIQSQSAMQQLKSAEADFTSANSQFVNILQRQAYERKVALAAQKKLQVDLESALLLPTLQKQVDDALLASKTAHMDSPYQAADTWNKQSVPELQSRWAQTYKNNPALLREVLQSGAAMIASGTNELQSWAPQVVNAKIEGGLAKIPASILEGVGNIDSTKPVIEQVNEFNKIFDINISAYDALRKQADMLPAGIREGKTSEIDAKSINLKADASREFIKNGVAGLPSTQEGLLQIEKWKELVQHPELGRLYLHGSDKKSLMNDLESAKNEIIGEASDRFKMESAIGSINAKVLQGKLIENFDNPQVRNAIVAELSGMAATLQDKIAEVQKMPDNPLKLPQILAYKQELASIVGTENVGLQQRLSFEGIARAISAQGRAILEFGQRQESRGAREDYNVDWQSSSNRIVEIMGMPIGAERLKAAQAHADVMLDINEKARNSKAITGPQYQENLKSIQSFLVGSQYVHRDGLFGFGATDRQPIKAKEKAKASLEASAQLASLASDTRNVIGLVQEMNKLAKARSKDPAELAAVQANINTWGKGEIEARLQEGMTIADIRKNLATVVSRKFDNYHNGKLR